MICVLSLTSKQSFCEVRSYGVHQNGRDFCLNYFLFQSFRNKRMLQYNKHHQNRPTPFALMQQCDLQSNQEFRQGRFICITQSGHKATQSALLGHKITLMCWVFFFMCDTEQVPQLP